MYKASRFTRSLISVFAFVSLIAGSFSPVVVPLTHADTDQSPSYICHWGDDDSYKKISPDNKGQINGHTHHDEDIIPPSGSFAGQNWDAWQHAPAGFENTDPQKVWENNCTAPTPNPTPEATTGSIQITKYICPENTPVTRGANGVGGAVPEGCTLQPGATFGYVHGTQTDANAPFPELGTPLTAGGMTDANGVLTIANLDSAGRYLVAETNAGNEQLAAGDILGLYCEGDADTSGTNDNQELTFVPAGGVAQCVAYNKAATEPESEPAPIKVHIFKYLLNDGVVRQIPNDSDAPDFPMIAQYSIAGLATNLDPGDGYVLGNGGGVGGSDDGLLFAANTVNLAEGDIYGTYEVTGGDSPVVASEEQCAEGKYLLKGYKVGDSLEQAQAAEISLVAPSFNPITASKYVIVVNEACGNSDETPGNGDGGHDETVTNQTIVVRAVDLANNIGDVIASTTKWFFYNDESDAIDNSLGSFVTGPETAPIGVGSAQMSVSGSQRRNIATYQFKNVKLADIEKLAFSTYSQSASNGSPSSERSAYLQFNVDFNNSDLWQKRLVFLPSANGTVVNDTWQDWDAINSGNALWLYSGATWPTTMDPGTSPKTWAQILALYPNAETRSTDSWLGFRVGEPYSDGFTGNVDKFVITIGDGSNATTTTYDFEPAQVVDVPTDTPAETGDQEQSTTTTSSRRSGGSGSLIGGGEVLAAETGPAECSEYLLSYIKPGTGNDAGEVAKLQTFLNAYEGDTLAVTGTYDQATLAAVHAFQNKYASDILAPWGLRASTGYVYYTTRKEVNTIYCKSQKDFPLSQAQIEEIAAIKARQGTPDTSGEGTTSGATISSVAGNVVLPDTKADKNAEGATDGKPQTAAAANASSTPSWFGKFVHWLFGK